MNLWHTTARYWARTSDGGEVYVRLQRHRLMPWRGRERVMEFPESIMMDVDEQRNW